jgi:Zn-finger nucleic acid-binding protein
MTCENCGAPVHLSRDQLVIICDYCGNQTAPPADDDGVRVLVAVATSHHCPTCEAPLSDASLESQELLYCTRCHGMLIDMQQFPPLVEDLREHGYRFRSSQAPRAVDTARVLHCPLCKREMDRRPFRGGAAMDLITCGQCLMLWLDRGNLGKIVAA